MTSRGLAWHRVPVLSVEDESSWKILGKMAEGSAYPSLCSWCLSQVMQLLPECGPDLLLLSVTGLRERPASPHADDTVFESLLSVGPVFFLFSHVLICMREIPLLHCSNGSYCLNIYNFFNIKCLTVIINYLMRCHKLQIQVIPSNPPQNHPP